MKHHLKRAIGEATLTFEELATALYQIEAAINSRPLCQMSADPNDIETSTPAHFLMNSASTTISDEDLRESRLNWLTRWQLVQRIHQQFWTKWQMEYLNGLQSRKKWQREKANVKEGEIVLIKNENYAPTRWQESLQLIREQMEERELQHSKHQMESSNVQSLSSHQC